MVTPLALFQSIKSVMTHKRKTATKPATRWRPQTGKRNKNILIFVWIIQRLKISDPNVNKSSGGWVSSELPPVLLESTLSLDHLVVVRVVALLPLTLLVSVLRSDWWLRGKSFTSLGQSLHTSQEKSSSCCGSLQSWHNVTLCWCPYVGSGFA